MSYRPQSPVSAPRVVLLATTAALVTSALLLLATWGARAYIAAYHPTPDANIGAGMLLTFVPALLSPLVAWPLLRLVRLPFPGFTALIAALPYFVLSVIGMMVWGAIDSRMPIESAYTSIDPLLTMGVVDALALAVALSGAALVTAGVHRARLAQGTAAG